MDLSNSEMVAGVLGNFTEKEALRQPEMLNAVKCGAFIGPYILNNIIYPNGYGAWLTETLIPQT